MKCRYWTNVKSVSVSLCLNLELLSPELGQGVLQVTVAESWSANSNRGEVPLYYSGGGAGGEPSTGLPKVNWSLLVWPTTLSLKPLVTSLCSRGTGRSWFLLLQACSRWQWTAEETHQRHNCPTQDGHCASASGLTGRKVERHSNSTSEWHPKPLLTSDLIIAQLSPALTLSVLNYLIQKPISYSPL